MLTQTSLRLVQVNSDACCAFVLDLKDLASSDKLTSPTLIEMLKLSSLPGDLAISPLQFAFAFAVPFVLYRIYLVLRQRPVPTKAPALIPENIPIFGSLRFFTARWDFFRNWFPKFPSFSFFVGSNHVIAVSGDAARTAFFDSRELDFGQG